MAEPLLKVAGLRKAFGRSGSAVAALDGVDLAIDRRETLALAGASGSGKTTLARIVLRLTEPDAGSVHLAGADMLALRGGPLRAMRSRFQMVFQDPLAAFNPRATVGHILADPLRLHGLASKAEHPAAVAALLARVHLSPDLAARRPAELSGGQRQRVAIARAIATKPELIVLDEPVSALDVSVRAQILNLLIDLQAETGVAYLLISHDLAVVRAVAHRVAVIDAGRIVETGVPDAVFRAPAAEATKRLVAAVPRMQTATNGAA